MAKRKPKQDPDAYVRAIVTANPNMLVPFYLMSCWLYYVLDSPVVSDKLFDEMTKSLMAQWDTIEHWHKELVTMEDLVAGTGFALKYPIRTVQAAKHLKEMFST